jgi:hypothetical protein
VKPQELINFLQKLPKNEDIVLGEVSVFDKKVLQRIDYEFCILDVALNFKSWQEGNLYTHNKMRLNLLLGELEDLKTVKGHLVNAWESRLSKKL